MINTLKYLFLILLQSYHITDFFNGKSNFMLGGVRQTLSISDVSLGVFVRYINRGHH